MSDDVKQVMDNVHKLITLSPLATKIINTPQFKRLKLLKQLSNAHEVYPTTTTTRFEHSLGVMHIAGKLCDKLGKKWVSEEDKLCVEIAGLCHDLGHGPFSHLWEFFVREARVKWDHEDTSLKILDIILEDNNINIKDYNLDAQDLDFIKELINGELPENKDKPEGWKFVGRGPDKYYLYEIISNKESGVDVDKWDYFLRDSMATGIKIVFDYERLLENMCVVPDKHEKYGNINRLAFRRKEADMCQEMFRDRSRLHKHCYQHKVVKIIDKMMIDAWLSACDHYPEIIGTDGKKFSLAEACQDPRALLKLSDDLVNQTIMNSEKPEMKQSQELLTRIARRDLYFLVLEVSGTFNGDEEANLKNQIQKSNLKSELENLRISKQKIDMGKKDKNPVTYMVFVSKSGEQEKLSEEDLDSVAPSKISSEKMYIMLRNTPDDEKLEAWKSELKKFFGIEEEEEKSEETKKKKIFSSKCKQYILHFH